AQHVYSQSAFASWDYNTNITDYNSQKSIEASGVAAAFSQEASRNASQIEGDFPEDIQRQLDVISYAGTAALGDPDKVTEFNTIRSDMMSIYSQGQVCHSGSNSD
ncbi:M2 family metallopeptidase, partial [Salmonella sp. s54395]|uniref:M2 family metallopeptidase n=1 Tax=Salmonella sp. s54395 TaxID=3159664 RepID=UPI00397EF991